MISEIKTLFKNIKKFKQPLNEGANDNLIIKAIQNYEYVYIYYGGDGKNKKGI